MNSDLKNILKRAAKIDSENELEDYVVIKMLIKELTKISEGIKEDAELVFQDTLGSAPSQVLGCNVVSYVSNEYGYSSKLCKMEKELKLLKEDERSSGKASILTTTTSIKVTVQSTIQDIIPSSR